MTMFAPCPEAFGGLLAPAAPRPSPAPAGPTRPVPPHRGPPGRPAGPAGAGCPQRQRATAAGAQDLPGQRAHLPVVVRSLEGAPAGCSTRRTAHAVHGEPPSDPPPPASPLSVPTGAAVLCCCRMHMAITLGSIAAALLAFAASSKKSKSPMHTVREGWAALGGSWVDLGTGLWRPAGLLPHCPRLRHLPSACYMRARVHVRPHVAAAAPRRRRRRQSTMPQPLGYLARQTYPTPLHPTVAASPRLHCPPLPVLPCRSQPTWWRSSRWCCCRWRCSSWPTACSSLCGATRRLR